MHTCIPAYIHAQINKYIRTYIGLRARIHAYTIKIIILRHYHIYSGSPFLEGGEIAPCPQPYNKLDTWNCGQTVAYGVNGDEISLFFDKRQHRISEESGGKVMCHLPLAIVV